MLRAHTSSTRWLVPIGLAVLTTTLAFAALAAGRPDSDSKQPAAEADNAVRDEHRAAHQATAAAWQASHPDGPGHPSVSVGGVVVMRFRVASGGYTAQERSDIVQHRLIAASSGLDYQSLVTISTGMSDGGPVITLRGQRLVTVTNADAEADGGTAMDLANTWAANLRRGFAATQ